MDNDLGLLVDYLRGELDQHALLEVRRRLEADDAFFAAFQRLRRTFALLRSLPHVNPARAPGDTPEISPRAAYLADLQREFETRGWVDLLPALPLTPEFVALLRAEFGARALVACIPPLEPGVALLAALRARFHVESLFSALPAARVRSAWVRALRHEFVVRATIGALPEIEVRPAFAAGLRQQVAMHALSSVVPQIAATDRFRRRLQVSLFEHERGQLASAVKAAPALPSVAADDPFRRRLFRQILKSGRKGLSHTPVFEDPRDFEFGRRLASGWRRARRSLGATLAVHVLAIAAAFFITTQVITQQPMTVVAELRGDQVVVPLQPGSGVGLASPTGDKAPTGRPPEDPLPPPGLGMGGSSDIEYRPVGPPLDDAAPPAPPPAEGRPELVRMSPRTDTLAWFRMRAATRIEKIAYLGAPELYAALERALLWLRNAQQREGYWDVRDPVAIPVAPGLREIQRVELTAAALLAFLGDGHSSHGSLIGYDENVRRGTGWLIKQQRPDGHIGPEELPIVLGHAIATLALAEDFGLSRDARLRKPLRDACRWLSAVRDNAGGGGFPYRVGQPASLMTGVWAHMALATARNVGVPDADAPRERIDELLHWFGVKARTETLTDGTELLAGELLPAAAAASLTGFAADAGLEITRNTFLDRLGKESPNLEVREVRAGDTGDMRYLFFGSLAFALEQQRTRAVSPWQAAFEKTLLSQQISGGADEGTFAPTSKYAELFGPVFSTAFAALSIENAYRVQMMK